MSLSNKVSRKFEFLCVFGASKRLRDAEKSQGAAEKNKEKVEAKVLFIFRCSKNWQKKSAGNHLLNK